MASARELSPLAQLVHALREEKIRFLFVGMAAAILQGVPATTLDTDLWVDVPERAYMRLLNLASRLGAVSIRQTVIELVDGSLVNFCYRLDGVASFQTEFRRGHKISLFGTEVRALPLERIIKSKAAAGREKDLAMLPLLRDIAASRKELRIRR